MCSHAVYLAVVGLYRLQMLKLYLFLVDINSVYSEVAFLVAEIQHLESPLKSHACDCISWELERLVKFGLFQEKHLYVTIIEASNQEYFITNGGHGYKSGQFFVVEASRA